MLTLTQLEYLVAVEKFGHFGKAAESCSVAQPSLSAQIQKFENQLGIKIFERTKNSFYVTEVGKEIIQQARRVLEETRRIDDIVQGFKTELRGTLKLGVIPTIAPFFLPYILPALRSNYPGLRLEIIEKSTNELIKHIDTSDVDAAILSTPKQAPETLLERVLFYEPFVLFSSTSHPLRKKTAVSVEELGNHVPFLLNDTHCLREQVEELCHASVSEHAEVQVSAGSLHTLVEVVNLYGGYTLLPQLAQDVFRKTYPDSFRDFDLPKPSRKISLVFHRSFLKRPLIEALAKLVNSNLPKGVVPVDAKIQTQIIDPLKSRFG